MTGERSGQAGWLSPLKFRAQVLDPRQDSPVPLAAFARCQKREARNLAARNDEKPFSAELIVRAGFGLGLVAVTSKGKSVATVDQHEVSDSRGLRNGRIR